MMFVHCPPIRVKALFGEWDHIAVVVEMDRTNCGGKGDDGRNNRKLVLLEVSKTVVILRDATPVYFFFHEFLFL